MPITTYETNLLTSAYGVGREEALVLGQTLNAIEYGFPPLTVHRHVRRAVRQLGCSVLTAREAYDFMAAIENCINGSPDAERDREVIAVCLSRMRIAWAWSEPELLEALYNTFVDSELTIPQQYPIGAAGGGDGAGGSYPGLGGGTWLGFTGVVAFDGSYIGIRANARIETASISALGFSATVDGVPLTISGASRGSNSNETHSMRLAIAGFDYDDETNASGVIYQGHPVIITYDSVAGTLKYRAHDFPSGSAAAVNASEADGYPTLVGAPTVDALGTTLTWTYDRDVTLVVPPTNPYSMAGYTLGLPAAVGRVVTQSITPVVTSGAVKTVFAAAAAVSWRGFYSAAVSTAADNGSAVSPSAAWPAPTLNYTAGTLFVSFAGKVATISDSASTLAASTFTVAGSPRTDVVAIVSGGSVGFSLVGGPQPFPGQVVSVVYSGGGSIRSASDPADTCPAFSVSAVPIFGAPPAPPTTSIVSSRAYGSSNQYVEITVNGFVAATNGRFLDSYLNPSDYYATNVSAFSVLGIQNSGGAQVATTITGSYNSAYIDANLLGGVDHNSSIWFSSSTNLGVLEYLPTGYGDLGNTETWTRIKFYVGSGQAQPFATTPAALLTYSGSPAIQATDKLTMATFSNLAINV